MEGPLYFDSHGLLPPGDYELTFEELRHSLLVRGPGHAGSTWDTAWRESLVGNLEVMTRQLWQAGIREVFADGSFVEEKDHPNDVDGYFVCALVDLASGELTRKLNLLDPYKIWTWDPRSPQAFRGYPKKQLPMWHRYRVELYPHVAGFFSGIRDLQGNELEFPSAFRQSRLDGRPRGIIKLKFGRRSLAAQYRRLSRLECHALRAATGTAVFVRPGELRKAEWSEMDLVAGEWRIPAERMKMKAKHVVPLSTQAVAVLRALQPLTGKGRYVFPGARSRERPISARGTGSQPRVRFLMRSTACSGVVSLLTRSKGETADFSVFRVSAIT